MYEKILVGNSWLLESPTMAWVLQALKQCRALKQSALERCFLFKHFLFFKNCIKINFKFKTIIKPLYILSDSNLPQVKFFYMYLWLLIWMNNNMWSLMKNKLLFKKLLWLNIKRNKIINIEIKLNVLIDRIIFLIYCI